DIKHLGEELNITLIKNKEFNEDNLMRYHFVSYSDENYDPTASYVLQFLKNKLTNFRNTSTTENYQEIEDFINSYTESLKSFFENCKNVIERAKTEPKYFKLFVVLNLSATLYPLIVKLESLKLLDKNLETKNYEKFTFYDLIELIEVRVYKTRATDPKADISRLVFDIDKKSPIDIQNWLLWFNGRWMSKEEFQSRMYGWIFGNRALNHIFINYSESLQKKEYKISELIAISNKNPNIEHILAQTPTFAPRALGFKNKEDFIDFEHNLGNLTILERSLNSSIQNKSAIDKVEAYGKSTFIMTKMIGSEIDTKKTFTKTELNERTKLIAEYCLERWWC
ncbi:HNH endonuclease, partial [Flavobacterium psychrophilum]|nr:HNH endonuclease [Flavobacterium psychrophilum]